MRVAGSAQLGDDAAMITALRTDTLDLFVQDSIDAGPHRALCAIGYTDHETAGNAWTGNVAFTFDFLPHIGVIIDHQHHFR